MKDSSPQPIRTGPRSGKLRYLLLFGLVAASGVITTGLLSKYAGRNDSSFDSEAEREAMHAIGAATHQWQVYFGDAVCPSIRQLVERKSLSPNAQKVDAWQQPFRIRCMDTEVIVSSSGPDRVRGTFDDIVVAVRRRR